MRKIMIDCPQEIPCNPCHFSCKVGAIHIDGLKNRPEYYPEKCVGCKACMQIGCPAIAVRDKKARVDTTLCVGCDVCRQMCRFGALVRPDGRNA